MPSYFFPQVEQVCQSAELLELEFELPLLLLVSSEPIARNKNAPTINVEPIVLKYCLFNLFEFRVDNHVTYQKCKTCKSQV